MWLVVGLGNPGRDYVNTRHNAGFLVLKRTAASWGVRFTRRRGGVKTGSAERFGEDILLALPQTYMNRSGIAVRALMSRRGLAPERLIVVYDDLDIDLGEIRIRKAGSPGTHKGLKSVSEEIGSRDFARIRIGIGPLPTGGDATSFVLSRFSRDEKPLLDEALARAQEALALLLAGETDKAMVLFNRRKKPLSISREIG